jgi:hypothetical protein
MAISPARVLRQGAEGKAERRDQRERHLHPPRPKDVEREPDRKLRRGIGGEEHRRQQPELAGRKREFDGQQRTDRCHHRA